MNSKKFALNVVSKLREIYNVYEEYILRNDKAYLKLFMYDNQICFYLYKGNEEIDNMGISFDIRDSKMYEYICIMLMINIFGKFVIHNKNNIFFNERHMPYFELVVLDSNLIMEMKSIKELQKKIHIDEEIEVVKKREKKLPRRIYLNNVINDMDNRIALSKGMLSRW